MKPGFYTIMAAQFFSSLADNALLVAAIALLAQLAGPAWMVPMLKFFFVVSYVVLAAFVGAFADSMPKGRVMFITNLIKVGGCTMMLLYQFLTPGSLPPYVVVLLAYAVVGFGAAAYSPAKYGILTELLPPQQLVAANGWIEGTTVGLDHPRHRARRRAGVVGRVVEAPRVRLARSRHLDRHGPGSGDRRHRVLLRRRGGLQPVHSRHRGRPSAAHQATRCS